MIWVILYVVIGMGFAMSFGRGTRTKGTGSFIGDLAVDVILNLIIILCWPLFALYFIYSCVVYTKKKRDKENKK